ncbi:MAG: SPOR domain-containing protein [Gammaproteobacteria bacterium]|jgi:DedD protein|nr:SPOR domain-containing protein [Gammaproteobacteria bacterium]
MDRQLLERLIGAGVLVVALVIVAPAILDNDDGVDREPDDVGREPAVSATANEPLRTLTIRLDKSTQTPPVAREVTKPADDAGQGQEPAFSVVIDVMPKVSTSVASKPAASKPQAKASAKPPVAPKPSPVKPLPKTGWVVQLGSFSNQKNAQQLADAVGKHGFSVFLMPLDRSGKKLYRVRVGPRDTRAQAEKLAGKLVKVGYTGQVTRQLPDA